MSAKFLDKLFGRTGNRLFQMSALYGLAKIYNNNDFYFQTWTPKDDFVNLIREELGIGSVIIDRVAVHVRRAKNPINPEEQAYSENKFYTNLIDTGYYQKAMSQFPDRKFLVFSDDISWCKKQDIFLGCEFSTNTDEEKDLFDMSSCTDQIIANSSFSYWAALLNVNPDKKVIAPKAWYADGVERTVCPPEWIKIWKYFAWVVPALSARI